VATAVNPVPGRSGLFTLTARFWGIYADNFKINKNACFCMVEYLSEASYIWYYKDIKTSKRLQVGCF
jgi:hypothetical protein